MMMMKKKKNNNNNKNCYCCKKLFGFRRMTSIVFQILIIIYIIVFQCIISNYNILLHHHQLKKNNNNNADTTTTTTKSHYYLQKQQQRRRKSPTTTYDKMKKRMQMMIPFPPPPSSSSATKTTTTTTTMVTAVESPVLLQMMMKTKENINNNNNIVLTRSTRQGYYFHKDFLDWNLHDDHDHDHDDNDDNNINGTSSSSSSSSKSLFTKTICVTDQNRYIGSTQSIQERFYNINTNYNWSYLLYPPSKSKSPNNELDLACKYSRVRILFERNVGPTNQKYTSKLKLKHLFEHVEGQQLTARILGGSDIDKGSLIEMIMKNSDNNENENSDESSKIKILKNSIPKTYVFNSTESCIQFCNNNINNNIDIEWSSSSSSSNNNIISQNQQQQKQKNQNQNQQNQHWIFKPKFLSEGKGIISIGSTVNECNNHCIKEGGNTLTAQAVISNPLTLPPSESESESDDQQNDDNNKRKGGRKLDIRSIIFVANVHPLIVYTGGEYVRICAEPIIINNNNEKTTTTTTTTTTTETTTQKEGEKGKGKEKKILWEWNKFQQICNMDVTKHISYYHDDPSLFVRPFLEETVIESRELRNRLLHELDQHNSALVELLYKERWTNPTWMDDNDNNNDNNNDHDHNINNKTKTSSMKNRNKVGMFQALAADYLIANNTTTEGNNDYEIVLLELNSQPGYTGRFGIDYPNPWGDIMLIEWTILSTYNKYHNTNKATTKQRNGGGDDDGVGEEGGEDWKVELEQRLSELDLETLRRLKL